MTAGLDRDPVGLAGRAQALAPGAPARVHGDPLGGVRVPADACRTRWPGGSGTGAPGSVSATARRRAPASSRTIHARRPGAPPRRTIWPGSAAGRRAWTCGSPARGSPRRAHEPRAREPRPSLRGCAGGRPSGRRAGPRPAGRRGSATRRGRDGEGVGRVRRTGSRTGGTRRSPHQDGDATADQRDAGHCQDVDGRRVRHADRSRMAIDGCRGRQRRVPTSAVRTPGAHERSTRKTTAPARPAGHGRYPFATGGPMPGGDGACPTVHSGDERVPFASHGARPDHARRHDRDPRRRAAGPDARVRGACAGLPGRDPGPGPRLPGRGDRRPGGDRRLRLRRRLPSSWPGARPS